MPGTHCDRQAWYDSEEAIDGDTVKHYANFTYKHVEVRKQDLRDAVI